MSILRGKRRYQNWRESLKDLKDPMRHENIAKQHRLALFTEAKDLLDTFDNKPIPKDLNEDFEKMKDYLEKREGEKARLTAIYTLHKEEFEPTPSK